MIAAFRLRAAITTERMARITRRKIMWHLWRSERRLENNAIHADSEPPDVARSARRSTVFERIELASAILVVLAILNENWDILPMAIHPTTKEGLKAIGGIAVAVFI